MSGSSDGLFVAARLPGTSWLVAGMTLASLALPVSAQDVYATGSSSLGATSPGGPSLGDGSGSAEGTRRGWKITPGISISETVTDNVGLASANKRGEQITEITPGIAINGESSRLKGFLNYQLHETIYARDSQSNQTQQSLNSSGTLVAIEKWLFVDASGVITQQNISAFGTQSTSNSSVNANRTETSVFQVSPYVRGKLGPLTDYEFRYRRGTSRSKSDLASDIDTDDVSARLNGAVAQSNLSWLIEGTRQKTEYSGQRATDADRLRAYLSYQPDPQLKLTLIGGSESNNYLSLAKEKKTTSGYGFDWAPSERTKFSATKESRFFGEGHSLNFAHRMPLMALTYADTRDVSVLPNQLAVVNLGTNYDLLNSLWANLYPDPAIRAQQVTGFLQAYGLPPNAPNLLGFMSSQVSVERLQVLSLITYGVRNVITLSLTQSNRQSLGVAPGLRDDFSISPTVKQRGFNVNWGYRLSAVSSLDMLVSQQNSIAPSAGALNTRQRNFNIGVTTKFGSKSTGSLLLRRSLFESVGNPYSENALVAAFSIQF